MMHYYFELEDRSILFLSADQPLDVYALPEGYSEKQGPLFPNSDFSLLRDASTGDIIGMALNGVSMQAEELVVPNEEAYDDKLFLKNGETTQATSYDEVKRRILGG